MKKMFSIGLLILFYLMPLMGQKSWLIDKSHTKIGFNVTHLLITEVEGNFTSYQGTLMALKDDFTDAFVDFSVDVSSINTGNVNRDNHLKGEDFFAAEKYPAITFKSTSFKKVNGNNYILEGYLQIKDVSKSVKWEVVYGGTIKDPYGNIKSGFKAQTTINRFDYGLKWNTMTEAGGAVVSSDVKIVLNLQFNLQN